MVGGIPYGIWVIATARKKRWQRVQWQVGTPLATLLALIGASAIVNHLEYQRYLENLYDARVRLPSPLFEHRSPRTFIGEREDAVHVDIILPPPLAPPRATESSSPSRPP